MKRIILCALVALACHEDITPLDLAGPASSVIAVDGNHTGGVGGSVSLAVKVTDDQGRPVISMPVNWSAARGDIPAVDSTDGDGVSTVTMTLPDTPGMDQVTAQVDGAGSTNILVTTQPVGGTITFRFLDAGGYHACGITTTEQLICWGYGADGQLGIGATDDKLFPTLIPGDLRYRRVVGGFYHACGWTLASTAYCWGNNGDGRVGGNAGGTVTKPEVVTLPQTIDTLHGDTVVVGAVELLAQAMGAGETHTCGVDLAQRLWCWGRNSEGQLGRGDFSTWNPPSLANSSDFYKAVSAGGLHTCAITVAGTAQCWGYNVAGQVGNGTVTNAATPQDLGGGFRLDGLVIFRSPDPDFPLPPGPFIAAGYDHSCAITVAGPTLCWGLNQDGQLGDGTQTRKLTPTTVSGGHAFAAITAGLRHTCALDTTGAAWCWGDNALGELGDSTSARRLEPVAVAGGIKFAYIKAGELFTCGVTSDGVVYCWGDNEYGQLGNGTTESSLVPVKVAFQP